MINCIVEVSWADSESLQRGKVRFGQQFKDYLESMREVMDVLKKADPEDNSKTIVRVVSGICTSGWTKSCVCIDSATLIAEL